MKRNPHSMEAIQHLVRMESQPHYRSFPLLPPLYACVAGATCRGRAREVEANRQSFSAENFLNARDTLTYLVMVLLYKLLGGCAIRLVYSRRRGNPERKRKTPSAEERQSTKNPDRRTRFSLEKYGTSEKEQEEADKKEKEEENLSNEIAA